MKNFLVLFLLAVPSLFAANSNAELNAVMSKTVIEQGLKMFPLFLLGTGVAIFFTLIQKRPREALIGCSGLCGLAFAIGLFCWILEFIAAHAFAFVILIIILALIAFIVYVVCSSPSLPTIEDDYDPQEDKDNPFYEGPR